MTAVLRGGSGRVIATLHSGEGVAPGLAPRPYVSVETPEGVAVTETGPSDHPHHLGVSVTTPDVDGTNFWGGSTFVADVGPSMLDNHGRQSVEREERSLDQVTQAIAWHDHAGERVLAETRTVGVREVDGHTLLAWSSTIAAERDGVSVGSSHTNGRPGAFYGGIFWRTPFGTAEVRSADGHGVDIAHGSTSPWIVIRGAQATLVAATSSGLPWFVRAGGYTGFGPAIAVAERRSLERGTPLELDLVVALLDGSPTEADVDRAVSVALASTQKEAAV